MDQLLIICVEKNYTDNIFILFAHATLLFIYLFILRPHNVIQKSIYRESNVTLYLKSFFSAKDNHAQTQKGNIYTTGGPNPKRSNSDKSNGFNPK